MTRLGRLRLCALKGETMEKYDRQKRTSRRKDHSKSQKRESSLRT